MNGKNLVRIIGLLCFVALVVAIPMMAINIVTIWFMKNLIVMAVFLAADATIGVYLMYWIIRYMVIQAKEKLLT